MTMSLAEIASIRAEINRVQLDMVCDLQRFTPGAEDPYGHPAGTWDALESAVRCHYWEEDDVELVGSPNAELGRERVILPPRRDLKVGDRISRVLDSDGSQAAGVLDIREVLEREYDTLLMVRTIQ